MTTNPFPPLSVLRAEVRSVSTRLRKAQIALGLGPVSLAKAQEAPDLFDRMITALRTAPDPSHPSAELTSLLKALESTRKNTVAGFVVPSAEGNWVSHRS